MLSSVFAQKFKKIHTKSGMDYLIGEVITTHPLILPVRVGSRRDAEWGPRTCFWAYSWFFLWLGLELVSSLRCVLLLLDSDVDIGAKEVTKNPWAKVYLWTSSSEGMSQEGDTQLAGSLCLGVVSLKQRGGFSPNSGCRAL